MYEHESLLERVCKPHHDVDSILYESLFSENYVVDLICEPCYDTPPKFDKGGDKLIDYPIISLDSSFDNGGLVCLGKDGIDLEES